MLKRAILAVLGLAFAAAAMFASGCYVAVHDHHGYRGGGGYHGGCHGGYRGGHHGGHRGGR